MPERRAGVGGVIDELVGERGGCTAVLGVADDASVGSGGIGANPRTSRETGGPMRPSPFVAITALASCAIVAAAVTGAGAGAASVVGREPPSRRPHTAAVAGDLDPAFGDGGVVRTNTDGIEHGRGEPSDNDFATAVDVGPGGNIVAGGMVVGIDAATNAVVKHRRDGARASTFHGNGIAIGAGDGLGAVEGVDIGPRGGIAMVGDAAVAEGGELSAIAKLTRHGEPDPGFDPSELDGLLVGFNDVVVSASGSLFISGTAEEPGLAVVKATVRGELVRSFGDGGVAFTPIAGAVADGVALDGDGNVIVTGNAGAELLIARFNPDGSLDASFGVDGVAHVPHGPSPLATDVEIDADGKILVSATVRAEDHRLLHGSLVRLLPDGAIDRTFGDGGAVTIDVGGDVALASGVAVDSTGRIIVTGTVMDPETSRDVYVVRLLPDGSPDASFGDGGVATADLSDGHVDEAYDLAVDADDDIVVAGSVDLDNGEASERAFGVVRFLGSAG